VEVVAEPPLSLDWLWRQRHEVDVLHFHWRPDHYYAWTLSKREGRRRPPVGSQELGSWIRLPSFAGRLAAARLLGYRIAWTIHEVYPPETAERPPGTISRRVDRVGGRLLARASHVQLTHDDETAERARAELGRAVRGIHVVPHGSYVGVYPPGRPRADIRAELALADDVLIFLAFGQIRPDKSLPLLLEAFRSIPDRKLALVVAGRVCEHGSRRLLEEAAAEDSRIRLRLEYVPPERVRELFEAVDAAVFARSETWTSGSLILALSLGIPVVAAGLPPYDELVGRGRAGWLFRPGDVDSLRATLLEAAADPQRAAKGAAALEQAEALSAWSEIASSTAKLLRGASGRRNGKPETR
jgi:glycosyltransferase involved in cell wall biosynthesis